MEYNCVWILDMDFVHSTQQLGRFSYVFEKLSQGTNVCSSGFKRKYSYTKFAQWVKPVKILFLWRIKILHHLVSYLIHFAVRESYIIMWLLIHIVAVNDMSLFLAYISVLLVLLQAAFQHHIISNIKINFITLFHYQSPM